MADIFREIEEELRRENFAKLWARFGLYIIILVVVALVAAGGFVGWRQYRASQSRAEGVRYAAALDLMRQGKDAAAAADFGVIAKQASGAHGMLARFEQAYLSAKLGHPADAIRIYDQLSQESSLDADYRDMATLLGARYTLDTGDPKAVIARLNPLTDAASPWHPMALELTALADLKDGNKGAARAIYTRLADDLTAPQGLRARAAEMLTALGQ